MREAAVWIASILGPVLTIMGIWIFLKREEVERYWTSFKANPGMFYVGGIWNLILGFTVLSFYHHWSLNLAVIVTILGYWMVIKGILILFFPKWFTKFATTMVEHRQGKCLACIPFILGLILIFLAWF
jgi:hypothetical protein